MASVEIPNISLTVGALVGLDRLEESGAPTKLVQVARAVTLCIAPVLAAFDALLNAALCLVSYVGSRLNLTDGPDKHVRLFNALVFDFPYEWVAMLNASFKQLATS